MDFESAENLFTPEELDIEDMILDPAQIDAREKHPIALVFGNQDESVNRGKSSRKRTGNHADGGGRLRCHLTDHGARIPWSLDHP